jgi:hypothetical protein
MRSTISMLCEDRMEQQHLGLAPAAPLWTKTRSQHTRVVDDEQITRSDEFGKVAELAMRDLVAHHEQTRFITARRWALRDQRRRQLIIVTVRLEPRLIARVIRRCSHGAASQ